jgi:hypothetical protein
MTDTRPQLEETPARQGQSGTGLRWVLRISLALIVIAFAVIWAIYAGPLSGHGGQTNTTAATSSTVKEAASTAAPGSGPAERTTGG